MKKNIIGFNEGELKIHANLEYPALDCDYKTIEGYIPSEIRVNPGIFGMNVAENIFHSHYRLMQQHLLDTIKPQSEVLVIGDLGDDADIIVNVHPIKPEWRNWYPYKFAKFKASGELRDMAIEIVGLEIMEILNAGRYKQIKVLCKDEISLAAIDYALFLYPAIKRT